ncbi:hypothetical protein ABBQ32_006024 [Trebouxia sp. C0010 RCD-2024]
MQGIDGPDAEESGVPDDQELLGKRKRREEPHSIEELKQNPEEGKVRVVSTTEGDMSSAVGWFKGGKAGPTLVFASAPTHSGGSGSKDRQVVVPEFRSLAKDGVNRSFAAVYDGRHSPEAAKDAAERLHLILQREDAVVAKNSDEMTWSSEGGESGVQTEEGAMAAALTRAFRAIDEEVIGSLEAHKKRGQTGPLHGVEGLTLVQVGEVLYTANTAGTAQAVLCKAGKAVTIAKPSDKGHKEKVADLVDNKLLDEHDTVITVTPVISRHELEGEACTFVVLASAALLAALTPQQVVDIVDEAIKTSEEGSKQAAAEAALQALETKAAQHEVQNLTVVVALLNWD